MCARIHDAAFYFIDTTTDADMQSVTEASDCSFRRYEGLRLHSLKQQVTSAKENWGGEMEGNDRDLGVSVYEKANTLLENIEIDLDTNISKNVLNFFPEILIKFLNFF